MKKIIIFISLLLLASCVQFPTAEKKATFLEEYEVPNGKEYALFEYDSQYFFLPKNEDFQTLMSHAIDNKIFLPEKISELKASTGAVIEYIEQNNPRIKEEWKSLDDTVYFVENYKGWNVLNAQSEKLTEGLSSKEEAVKWLEDNINSQFCLIQVKQFISNNPHAEDGYSSSLTEAFGHLPEIQKYVNKNRVIEFYNNKPCEGGKQVMKPKKEYSLPTPVKFTSKSGNIFGIDDSYFNSFAFMYNGDALISPQRNISKKTFQNVYGQKINISTFEYVTLGDEGTGKYGSAINGEELPEIYVDKISETTNAELRFFGKYLKVYAE